MKKIVKKVFFILTLCCLVVNILTFAGIAVLTGLPQYALHLECNRAVVLYNFYPGYRWFSPFGTKWNGEKDEDPGGNIGVGDATGSVWALLYEAEGICYVNRTLGTNYPRQLPYTTEQTTDSYIPEYMLPELVEARLELAQSVLRVWRTQEVPAWYRYSLSHNMNVLYYKLRHSASCLDPESDGDLYQRLRDFLDDFDNDERKSYYLTGFVSD